MAEETFAARLRAMIADASPAPWSHEDDTTDGVEWTCDVRSGEELVFARGLDYWKSADLDLIVFLRNYADVLADALEAAEDATTCESSHPRDRGFCGNCPPCRLRVALHDLNARVAVKSAEGQPGS